MNGIVYLYLELYIIPNTTRVVGCDPYGNGSWKDA